MNDSVLLRLGTLFHIAESARQHPKLKVIHDKVMAELERIASDLNTPEEAEHETPNIPTQEETQDAP